MRHAKINSPGVAALALAIGLLVALAAEGASGAAVLAYWDFNDNNAIVDQGIGTLTFELNNNAVADFSRTGTTLGAQLE